MKKPHRTRNKRFWLRLPAVTGVFRLGQVLSCRISSTSKKISHTVGKLLIRRDREQQESEGEIKSFGRSFVRRFWSGQRRSHSLGKFLVLSFLSCLCVIGLSGLNPWITSPAIAQTTNLYIEPLTWDFIGLDSNNVNTGPNNFLNGARVCNVGSSVATNVQVRFAREGATNPYMTIQALAQGRSDTVTIPSLQPGSTPPNHHQLSGTPANCFDAYFNVVVDRTSAAYNTVQKYHIEARATNAGIVRTPINHQLYVEKLISQARNAVISFSGPSEVYVGDTVTYTLTSKTATAYPQLTISSDFPNAVFQFLNISTTYQNPAGVRNSSIYADACGWIYDYTDPGYHTSSSTCDGPIPDRYSGGKVGETVTTSYTIKILSTGNGQASNTFNVNHLILDFSGGSYHYNAQYGSGINVATITVRDRQADLSITKTHSGNFATGDNNYTLTVRNNGPNEAKGPITVTDTLPTGFSFVSATGTNWTCSANGQLVTCTNPFASDFLNGATSTILLTVKVAETAATNSLNTATVQGSTTDPNPNNNRADDPTTVIKGANIALSKDDSQADPAEETFMVGTPATYILRASNTSGFDMAGPLTIVDTLPTGLIYRSASGTGWTCSANGQNVTCTNPSGLTNGSTSTLNLTVDVQGNVTSPVTNTATLSSGGLDTAPSDNTASQTNVVTIPAPDLSISKTDGGLIFVQGQNHTYTINITNSSATNTAPTTGIITVTDTLPSNLTYISGTSAPGSTGWTCSASGQTITCTNPNTLAPGQSSAIQLTVRPTSTTALNNTASVTTPGELITSNNTSNTVTTQVVTTGDINLSVRKQLTQITRSGTNITPTCTTSGQTDTCTTPINPGDVVRYQVTVTNNSGGNGQDRGITLTDVVPSGLQNVTWSCSFGGTTPTNLGNGSNAGTNGSYNSCTGSNTTGTSPYSNHLSSGTGNNININTISLRKQGGQVVVTVDGTASSTLAGELSNSATAYPSAASGADSTPADNTYTVNSIVPGADLSLAKTNSVGLVQGSNSTYRLTVTNNSPTRSTTGIVTVTDKLPSQLNFFSASSAPGSSGWSCSYSSTTSIVTCLNNNALAPGSVSAVDITVTVQPTASGSVTNGGLVSTSGDTNPANNTAQVPLSVGTANPNLAITKTAGTLPLGSNGTYILTVNNIGTTVANAPIVVRDTLPTGLVFLSGTGTGWSCSATGQNVVCTNYSNIAAGATATPLTLNVLVGSQTAPSITNIASVDQVSGETALANNSTSLVSSVDQSADLRIVKTLVGNLVAGQNATYQLQVTNNGPSNVSGAVTITDTLQSGLTFVSGSGDGFICSASGATVTCTKASGLNIGSSATISLTVGVPSSASGSINNEATVSSPIIDPDSSNNTSSTGVKPVSPLQADLGITKTHFGTFAVGGQGTFSLEVRNYGPATVTGPITIADTLPNGLTLASFVGQDWSCSPIAGSNLTCTYSNPNGFPVNSTTGVDITVNIASAGSKENTATVSSNIPEPPGTSANNTAKDTVIVQASADLSVSKTTSSSFVMGNQATYTLRVTNNGANTAVSPMTLTDQLPNGLTYASASSSDPNWACPASSTNQDITCTYNAALNAGASTGNLLLTVNVTNIAVNSPANYTNQVTVFSSTPDPNVDNNTATITSLRSDTIASRDYGDAPNTYGVNASHLTSTTVFMGAIAPDAESAAATPADGTGDDVTGVDDEDGVSNFPVLSTTATTYSVSVTVTNTSGNNATLFGWLDFNRDGSFQASEGSSIAVANGTTGSPIVLTWNNLNNAGMTAGTTYARFRLTTDNAVTTSTPAGQAGTGEVEDYQLTITTPTAGSPNVLLVKRITAIRSGGTTTQFTTVLDSTSTASDPNDDHSSWPIGFLRGGGVTDPNPTPADPVRNFKLKPGDEVEYTVYFLNAGSGDAKNLVICDRVPTNQTFVPNHFSGQTPNDGGLAPDQQGIALAIGPTAPTYSDTTTYLTNVPDAPDRGEFFSMPSMPNPNRCNVANNPNGLVVVNVTRTEGPTVVTPATGAGNPASSYGFIRFWAKVN